MKYVLFLVGIAFLVAVEIARVYFIMPFPGSQEESSIELAYFLSNYIFWFRIVGIILIAYPAYFFLTKSKPTIKWTAITMLAFWLMAAYAFNFRFLADKMFYQPENKILLTADKNKVSNKKLVLGIYINGQAKAYPIEIIGYHHQVRDTVGGEQVMVTYCTVCRSGRVYKPEVDGQLENFRLVGMDHFNAMFEDATTKSWWRQATGKAVAGKLKGTALKEIESAQMSLGAWMRKHPNTMILQPDPVFAKQYKGLEGFDEGTIKSGLEKRDSASWQFKSWVIGIEKNGHTKAYDWNDLVKQRVINDTFQNTALVLVLENDNRSFHVWNRQVKDKLLQFTFDAAAQTLKDTATNSVWNMNGECVEGILKNNRLTAIQAYQEFWHSWESFHPGTGKY